MPSPHKIVSFISRQLRQYFASFWPWFPSFFCPSSVHGAVWAVSGGGGWSGWFGVQALRVSGYGDGAVGRQALPPAHRGGAWVRFFNVELPTGPDGRRRRLRRGGYPTREQAADALAVFIGDPADIPGRTVRSWLEQWLSSRVAIRPETRRSYRELIRNYLVPHLGAVPLAEVRTGDVQRMFNSIISEHELTGEALSAATLQRIHAVVRAAFNAAIRQGLITATPTRGVELPQVRLVRAVVWSDERVAAWRRDGVRPAVAVWTTAQTGAFLRSIPSHRLYALFHLLVLTGLRRGEACGLRWTDLDSDSATLAVSRQVQRRGGRLVESSPKSNAGIRTIALDHTTLTALRQHRHRQDQERQAAGSAWREGGWIFTYADGRPVAPDRLMRMFARLVADSGLPPVRLHDLRHGAASLALAAGGEVKNISTMLGHASIQTTADTYTSVLPRTAHDAAERTATMLFDTGRKTRSPMHRYRHGHARTTTRASEVPARVCRAGTWDFPEQVGGSDPCAVIRGVVSRGSCSGMEERCDEQQAACIRAAAAGAGTDGRRPAAARRSAAWAMAPGTTPWTCRATAPGAGSGSGAAVIPPRTRPGGLWAGCVLPSTACEARW